MNGDGIMEKLWEMTYKIISSGKKFDFIVDFLIKLLTYSA